MQRLNFDNITVDNMNDESLQTTVPFSECTRRLSEREIQDGLYSHEYRNDSIENATLLRPAMKDTDEMSECDIEFADIMDQARFGDISVPSTPMKLAREVRYVRHTCVPEHGQLHNNCILPLIEKLYYDHTHRKWCTEYYQCQNTDDDCPCPASYLDFYLKK